MLSKLTYTLLIVIFLFSCEETNERLQTDQYSAELNKLVSGELAFEVTDYVEDYWRVVGNAGFDSSIYKVVKELETAGFINENSAEISDRLTYRIEKRPLVLPTWEPVNASLTILGEEEPLLSYSSNQNMIMLNSYSTEKEGATAEVIHIKDVEELKTTDVKGKIVYTELHPRFMIVPAIQSGALGILSYSNPEYLKPQKNTTSIQFREIPMDTVVRSWGVALSYEANEQIKNKITKGGLEVNVKIETNVYRSEELTLVAEIKGKKYPEKRLVFSSHVQEPGANDNATGVGVALEMASVTARLLKENMFDPDRTITFLWGDEIVSTKRYVTEDEERAKDIKWGISLDMVGENTDITGGSFLIEKMPDPSAIWTRGKDEHSEWGGDPLKLDEMKPHYLNDFVANRFREQGKLVGWQVKTNPYEGGSDHVPFLKANIPGVLFWHFTDQFYHTDNDQIDKVSKTTLKNVGVASLVCAYTLVNADLNTAKSIIAETKLAGLERLTEELLQGKIALKESKSLEEQVSILKAWEDWYIKALRSGEDLLVDESLVKEEINLATTEIKLLAKKCISELTNS